MKKLRVGIIGLGYIATKMAEALNGIKDEVVLYACASRSLNKAEQFKEEYGFLKAYGSYEMLAKDTNIDLVYIATPHSSHYEYAKLCINEGRNCLVEKAFCANLTQAKELVSLARSKNVFLAEAMWTRYQPSRYVIEELLSSGRIGQIHSLESDFSIPISNVARLSDPNLCGGALLDLGVYALTVARMYLGNDIKNIRMNVIKSDTNVDATTNVSLVYKSGTIAKTKCSMVDSESNYARITGDKGYIVYGPINAPEYVDIFDVDGNKLDSISISYKVNGYEYQILECKKAIEEGKLEPPSMKHEDTLEMQGWMDSIRYHAGILFPFEKDLDVCHKDIEVWKVENAFDDSDPWDRTNTTSYLNVYDIETGKIEVLEEFPYVIEAPNWSHDGTFLVYNSEGYIYKYDLKTKESKQIYSSYLNKMNNDHVLTSDDEYICVSDESTLDFQSRIFRIPLNGGEPTLITKNGPSYLHGISTDKEMLCYCAMRNGEYDIYTIHMDGTGETQLTYAPRLNDGSEYDSTDEYIYFNSVRTGLMQAFRMKKDGTCQTQLTFDTNYNTWFPHISPDLKKIVMVSYHKGDLWPGDHVPNKMVDLRLMNSDGSDLKTIVSLFGGQGTINVNSWSPDSKKFAYVSYKKGLGIE